MNDHCSSVWDKKLNAFNVGVLSVLLLASSFRYRPCDRISHYPGTHFNLSPSIDCDIRRRNGASYCIQSYATNDHIIIAIDGHKIPESGVCSSETPSMHTLFTIDGRNEQVKKNPNAHPENGSVRMRILRMK